MAHKIDKIKWKLSRHWAHQIGKIKWKLGRHWRIPTIMCVMRGIGVQINKYETAPNFIQLTQNLTSDYLLI